MINEWYCAWGVLCSVVDGDDAVVEDGSCFVPSPEILGSEAKNFHVNRGSFLTESFTIPLIMVGRNRTRQRQDRKIL